MSIVQDCSECPVGDVIERREFLRGAMVGVIGTLALPMRTSFESGVSFGAEKGYPIPAPDAVSIDKDESVIIANIGGRAYAFSLACPHQNTALRWDADDHRFQCPKHHSRYQADGTFIEGRATRGMDRFAIRRDGAQLLVDLDTLYRQDENADQWKAAFVSLA
jgi:nitrite reductase/ring-hydroxylating ferredoxin subunit